MSAPPIPQRTQVLVIGGGPAGSYSATVLAREGIDVVLLDMASFPRYHIGESLLPSVRHYLRFIDAERKVAEYGFAYKPGSAIKFNQYMREGYTDFVALGSHNSAWNVVRAEFDHLLLEHARESGANVYTNIKVDAVHFDPPALSARNSNGQTLPSDPLGRPVRATYLDTTTGVRSEIAFDYLIDASGRNGLLCTKYLKNRRYTQSLRNVAVWGYWRGAGTYGIGTSRQGAPFFEALSDESGWAWFIPLHNGLTSVGIVMDQKQLGVRSRAASSAACGVGPTLDDSAAGTRHGPSLAARYLTFLHLAPGVRALVGEHAELVRVSEADEGKEEAPFARSASDFSYSAERYAGEGWRVVGDAGAFIDPFFSSGVHLAMTSALSAAASVAASLRGDCTELEAAAYHSRRVAVSYTRFLVVVLSAYKQIRAQSANVLADIDEDGFDKAFAFFRPVIQGGADMGTKLSENEVQHALDFCVHLFNPTSPEQHESVRRRLAAAGEMQEEEDEDEVQGVEGKEDKERRQAEQTHDGPNAQRDEASALEDGLEDEATAGTFSADRLLDVRAPVIDPSALSRLLLRTRLGGGVRSMFRRSTSSPIVPTVSASASLALRARGESVSGARGVRGDDEQLSGPPSPVSAVFSVSDGRSRSSSTTTTLTDGDNTGGGCPSIHHDGASNVYEGGPDDDDDDDEVRMVLDKVNARRVIHAEHGEGLNSLEQEDLGGWVIRLQRGALGLRCAA